MAATVNYTSDHSEGYESYEFGLDRNGHSIVIHYAHHRKIIENNGGYAYKGLVYAASLTALERLAVTDQLYKLNIALLTLLESPSV